MARGFQIFGELSKVEDQDDGSIMVYGVASSGAKDEAGETVLPEAMKAALPEYGRYPALREMHGLSAAGRTVEAAVDDDGLTRIVAHVVDPVAVAKVKSKTYAGFSIGGKVLERDKADRTVITKLKLNEISLVDRPCNPEAAIDLWKADADVETYAMAAAPTNEEVKAEAEALAKAAGKDGKWKDFVVQAREALVAKAAEAGEAEVEEAGADGAETAEGVEAEAGEAEKTAAEGDLEKTGEAEPVVDPVAALTDALAKAKGAKGDDVKYADPKNSKYPIDTAKHIRAAWSYINMPKNQKGYSADEVKAIKDKIDSDGPPSAEKMEAVFDLAKTAGALQALAKRGEAVLLKGMYTVSRLAELIEQFTWLQNSLAWEAKDENDQSPLPAEAADNVAALLTLLAHMVAEESAEIVQAYKDQGLDIDFDPSDDEEVEVVAYAAAIVDLAKSDEALMTKVGARHSKADLDKVQGIHDHAAALGALCKADNCPADEADKAQATDDLAKANAEVDRLTKALTEAVPAIEDLQKTISTQAEDLTKALASISDLTKRLEQVENEPAMPRTAGSARAISKSDDAAGAAATGAAPLSKSEMEAYLASLPDAERDMLLTKAALRLPMRA